MDGCVVTYNFFVSQRPGLILSGNQIQTYWSCMISKLFRFSFFLIKKINSKARKVPHRTGPIREANPPADAITLRCNHSTSHVKWQGGRSRAASGPRQGTKNMPKCSEKASSGKNLDFRHSAKSQFFYQKTRFVASCKTIAWQRITFSFRNVQRWYFQEIKFKHIDVEWFQNIFDFHYFWTRKSSPKVENS